MPETSVRTCAATSTPPAHALVNAVHNARASALCTAHQNAAAYRHPITANGADDDMTRLDTAARGAPIIIPYRGKTATVPTLKMVSGRAAATRLDPRRRDEAREG